MSARLALAALVTLALLGERAHAVTCPTSAPCGSPDAAASTFVAGWAQDNDFPYGIVVHIYVDGVLVHAMVADGCRPDVNCHAFHWPHARPSAPATTPWRCTALA
jgi:hypothetical protein